MKLSKRQLKNIITETIEQAKSIDNLASILIKARDMGDQNLIANDLDGRQEDSELGGMDGWRSNNVPEYRPNSPELRISLRRCGYFRKGGRCRPEGIERAVRNWADKYPDQAAELAADLEDYRY